MKFRNLLASMGGGLALAVLLSGVANAATMIAASELLDLTDRAFVVGPVGPTVDSGLNTADANYGDFSGGAACPEGFVTCDPSTNPVGTIYTYAQTVTLGLNTIENDVPPSGAPLPADIFLNASDPQDPGFVLFYSLNFVPAGFTGVAGYDFAQARAADVSFNIFETNTGLLWNTVGDWTTGETITFFFESTQAPAGPGGVYSIGFADEVASARGPIPTSLPAPVPVPAGGLLLLTSLLGFRMLRKKG